MVVSFTEFARFYHDFKTFSSAAKLQKIFHFVFKKIFSQGRHHYREDVSIKGMKGCVDKGVRRARIRKKISQQRSGKGSDLKRLSDFLNRNKHNVFHLLFGYCTYIISIQK
jgi:hypothetical protein